MTDLSRLGKVLYRNLPLTYRTRDNRELDAENKVAKRGDLEKYLDSAGHLLDQLYEIIDQRFADAFPDPNPDPGGKDGQPWILPYIADLLDVRLYAPDAEGQRQEVANAVSWRQGRGTLETARQIVQLMTGDKAELLEGWQLTATTPNVGFELLPYAAFGQDADDETTDPLVLARHPGMPGGTVDFRTASIDGAAGAALATVAPRFPGSYRDKSKRTVDLRNPDYARGHVHPKRLLIYVAPPKGFFPLDKNEIPPEHRHDDLTISEDTVLEGHIIYGTLTIDAGNVRLIDCAVAVMNVAAGVTFSAKDCIFGTATIAETATLEYCTVMGDLSADRLFASDCIFAGGLTLAETVVANASCIRYSRIPAALEDEALYPRKAIARHANSTDLPVFFDPPVFCSCGVPNPLAPGFGIPAYGVLHPATPDSILFGAEDGGEMGAFHSDAHGARRFAVLAKLAEFLPLGIEPVIVPDPTLWYQA